MNSSITFFLSCASLVLLDILIVIIRKKNLASISFPASDRLLLEQHVGFYNTLNINEKVLFEKKVQAFLLKVRITGIKTTVEDIDKIFIAAAAIIPVFAFDNWEYLNLHEILLYPNAFNRGFDLEGPDRDLAGLVGDGPYRDMMLLSRPNLREGFMLNKEKNNTAIHEFVHLIDKTDGATDGVPESIIEKKYIQSWQNIMQHEILSIRLNESDINPYGATNNAEFFAVASEYFFQCPYLLEINHPELYTILSAIFRQQPNRRTFPAN